ncbi:MAG: SH3 domain-containing protein [Saprospiraceae bacterium]|nr:SH3 domain-containing protein [Saprospiraceae bacterium]
MAYGICPLSAVAIRNTSTDSSEMISQLLFGELVEVLEVKGHSWLKVHCLDDNCVGWVAANQLKLITPSEWEAYRNHYAWVLDYVQAAMSDDHYLPLTLGARLPGFDGMRFTLGEASYSFSGQAVFPKIFIPAPNYCSKLRAVTSIRLISPGANRHWEWMRPDWHKSYTGLRASNCPGRPTSRFFWEKPSTLSSNLSPATLPSSKTGSARSPM